MIEVIETILTLGLSVLAVLAAAAFVVFRQPVYAALAFATAVLFAAGLYVLQNAAYIAAATMVIYAGATIIIFLFVLMFSQRSTLQPYELKYSNLGVSIVASACMVLLLCYAVSSRSAVNPALQNAAISNATNFNAESNSTQASTQASTATVSKVRHDVAALGRVTYTRYLWSIELAGTLLLVAAGGAIVIAQRESAQRESRVGGNAQ